MSWYATPYSEVALLGGGNCAATTAQMPNTTSTYGRTGPTPGTAWIIVMRSMSNVSIRESPAAAAEPGEGSTEAVRVLVAGAEVPVDVVAELWLVPGQLQHAPGVADQIRLRIEVIAQQRRPAI